MGVVTKFQSIIIIRLIFFLVNQTQSICKAFVADIETREEHNLIYSKMNLLGVLSFIIGPIIGGYVFDMEQGFYYISIITFSITLAAVLLALILPNDKHTETSAANLAEKLVINFTTSVRSLNMQYGMYWNIILMKIYVTISVTVFFMKFSLLLKFLYNKGNIAIGYTYAYQSLLLFLTTLLVPLSEKVYEGQNIKRLSHSLSLLTISIANICYAPTYPMYLICFIPLSLAKSIFDSTFQNITNNNSFNDLSKGLDTITTLTSIGIPLVFGYFCDFYMHNAVKVFSIIPLVVVMLLMHFFTKKQFVKLKLN
ncbi:membrane transporter [Oryctes borbonicus]|uniref:Membrane transporter n=1 Tax=Oryctes borbonicus TaxID=1629725 RepID=A0A0T6B9C5_9SCAR|nr:membrane transporter [Oryctes borbonicus]